MRMVEASSRVVLVHIGLRSDGPSVLPDTIHLPLFSPSDIAGHLMPDFACAR